MEVFSHYRLIPTKDGYEVILFLNENNAEFATELGTTDDQEQKDLNEEAITYTTNQLPNVKVKAIKIVAGTLLITTLGFTNLIPKAEAATGDKIEQKVSRTYTVVPGDTLSEIAVKFGITVDAIRLSNNLSSDVIQVGQTLTIPNGTIGAPAQQTNYVVVSGDSLYLIAKRYETTVEAIKHANNLTSDFLTIGQTLTIPTGATQSPPQLKESTYYVVSGDTLSHIAVRNGTTVDAIKTRNNLTSDFLQIGQTLIIPGGTTKTTTHETSYVVVSGDTLSHIAARNGVSVDAIKRSNSLTSDFLQVGQVLTIPATGEVRTAPTTQVQTNVNQAEVDLLAKIIYAEARGESLEGQIAVAAVILNRVKSDQFPNTVRDVIYEQNQGYFQFTPAGNGALDNATPNASNYEAARRALAGEDPTQGGLFFYNPNKTSDQWVRSRTVSTVIGNHVFAF